MVERLFITKKIKFQTRTNKMAEAIANKMVDSTNEIDLVDTESSDGEVREPVSEEVDEGVGMVQLHFETLLQSVMVLLSKSLLKKKE